MNDRNQAVLSKNNLRVGQAEETLLGPAAAENLEDVLVMDGVEGGSPDRRPLLPDLPHFRKRHYHLP